MQDTTGKFSMLRTPFTAFNFNLPLRTRPYGHLSILISGKLISYCRLMRHLDRC